VSTSDTRKICPPFSEKQAPYPSKTGNAEHPEWVRTIKIRTLGEHSEQKRYERSEFRVAFDLTFAFSQIHENRSQKIAPRIERKRDSIEFERSENIGQFLMFDVFIKI